MNLVGTCKYKRSKSDILKYIVGKPRLIQYGTYGIPSSDTSNKNVYHYYVPSISLVFCTQAHYIVI